MSGERPRPQPGGWARVRLVRGSSRLGVWDVTAEAGESRITVGSADDIDWPVSSEGVEGSHFQFYWDGSELWISAPNAGSMLVDGEPVTDWRQLAGRCRVDFGSAAMLVETSSAAVATLSETALVEPIPDGSMFSDFVSEHEIETVLFEGTYDFEHGKHQPARRDDTTTRVGKTDKALPSDDVSDDDPTQKFETHLGRLPQRQPKIRVAVGVVLMALIGLGAVQARRALVQKEQKRVAAFWEQQQLAQDAVAERAAAALQARNDARALAQDSVAEFLESERLALEKQGADLLFTNAFERALPHYRKLAAAYPDEPAFSATVQVLQSKLRCRDGRRSTGEPCP